MLQKRVREIVKIDNTKIPAHVRKGNRRLTPKQQRYCELFAKTGDKWAAYHGAGYAPVHDYKADHARRSIYNIHMSQGVQRVLGLMLEATLLEMGVNFKLLLEKSWEAYNNADNVPDQLKALRLIADLAPAKRD